MNREDFHAPQAGRIVRVPSGYHAFVPAPLPPALEYRPELVLLLSRADAALSELCGLGRQLPNPHLLIAPYVRREAVLSSRIEGTRTTLSELLLDEMASAAPTGEADVREVRNYITAVEYGIERLATLPLSLRLVKEVHARLLEGVRGGAATPGEFRRSQNWIGPRGSTPETAPYVPPPPDEMTVCLGQWEHFLNERGRMPELVQCALVHEQFEAIHPFLDGNGRIGRLLVTLFLIERGRLTQPLLYLSDYIEANRQEYYDSLQAVRTRGEWQGWLRFFLEGVASTAQKAVRQAARLMNLREELRRKLVRSPRALILVDELFVNPYLTVSRAQRILQVTNPTARKEVRFLEAAGVVTEVTGRAWGRLYLSRPLLSAIESTDEETQRGPQ